MREAMLIEKIINNSSPVYNMYVYLFIYVNFILLHSVTIYFIRVIFVYIYFLINRSSNEVIVCRHLSRGAFGTPRGDESRVRLWCIRVFTIILI